MSFKNIFNIFSRKSVSFSWFISYMVMLAVVIFTNLFSYYASYQNLTKQLQRVNTELLDNRRQRLDSMQRNFDVIMAEISSDSNLQKIMQDMSVDGSYYYDSLYIKKRISTWMRMESTITNLYVYFHRTNYIVDSNSAKSADRFFKEHYQDKEMSYENYLQFIAEKSMGRYTRIPGRGQSLLEGDMFYTLSVFGDDIFTPCATVVIEVANEALVFEQESGKGRYFCILDQNRETLLAGGSELLLVQDTLQTMRERKTIDYFATNKAVVFSCESQQNKWRYVYIVDKHEFYQELNQVIYVFIVTVAVCLILGICFAYYMSVRNHKPIRRLMDQLSVKHGADKRRNENELQYIDKRMAQILEENEQQSRKVEIHNLVLRDAVFSLLLKDEPLSNISMDELLDSVGISFTEPYFAVVMFYIDNVKELFFEEASEKTEADNYELARLIISNILDDVMSYDLHHAFCELNGVFSCIINTARCENAEERIRQALLQTQDFTSTSFGLQFMAGVSQVRESREGLSDCYKEALACMEYKLLFNNQIVEYSSINESQPNIYYFPIEKEIRLIDTLKSGDYEKSQMLLQQIFEVNLRQTRPQIQMAKCLVYDIMGCVMKVLNDLGDLDGNNIFEEFKIFERIEKCKTVLSIQQELTDIFKMICEKSMNESVEKAKRLIEGVKTFVGSYYDDPNLSCEIISDHFKIHQSYLSTVFRKYTNQGLLEYIVKMRVEKAKQLLREPGMTVEKTAVRVGYANTRTFTRAFKKYMGTTPGKYREEAASEQERNAEADRDA